MKITCNVEKTRKLSELKEFQDDIKYITEKSLDNLIMLIEQNGFNMPFALWGDYIIDGHQRKKALNKMGIIDDEVPVFEIEAENIKDAKEKLLGATSQHGRFSIEGLQEFTVGLTDLDSVSLVDGPTMNLDFKVDVDIHPKVDLIDDIEVIDSDDYEQAEVEEIQTQTLDEIIFPDGTKLVVGEDRYFAEECVRMWNARNKAQKVDWKSV